MSCRERDQALLMLAHRELGGVDALRVRGHVALCRDCRARLRRYEALAGTLAAAFRNPSLGVRSFRMPRRSWASVGLLALLLSVLGWIAASNGIAATAPSPVAHPSCPLHAAHPIEKAAVVANHSVPLCDEGK